MKERNLLWQGKGSRKKNGIRLGEKSGGKKVKKNWKGHTRKKDRRNLQTRGKERRATECLYQDKA